MKFRHPQSNQVLDHSVPWLWVLLIGPLYFLFNGFFALTFFYVVGWGMVLFFGMWFQLSRETPEASLTLWFLLAYHVLFALGAGEAVKRHYVKKGWIPEK